MKFSVKVTTVAFWLLGTSVWTATSSPTNLNWADTNPSSFCKAVNNLGPGFSGPLNYTGEYPLSSPTGLVPRGFDDSVSLFIGGTYNSVLAAEIEGKVIVLGDFLVEAEGVNTIGKYLRLRLPLFVRRNLIADLITWCKYPTQVKLEKEVEYFPLFLASSCKWEGI